MSTCPTQPVDARSSAQHLAHTERHGTSIEVWIGLAYKLPIALGPEVFNPASRFCHAWHLVAAACFEQEHADVTVFGQTTRHHRPGRARSADNEVVVGFQFSLELLLIDTYALDKICRPGMMLMKRLLITFTSRFDVCIHFDNTPSTSPRRENEAHIPVRSIFAA